MMTESSREVGALTNDHGGASLQIAEEVVGTDGLVGPDIGGNGSSSGRGRDDHGDDVVLVPDHTEALSTVGEIISMNVSAEDEYSDAGGLILEQDRFLPIANISRIMKRVIPNEGKIAKDAKECCQECVSEFISFITSEASERCLNEKRKTINGEDLLYAMQNLGFDNYIDPLKIYLGKYREAQKGENKSQVSSVSTAAALLNAKPEEFFQLTGAGNQSENASSAALQPLQVAGVGTGQAQSIAMYLDPQTGDRYVPLSTSSGVQLIKVVTSELQLAPSATQLSDATSGQENAEEQES